MSEETEANVGPVIPLLLVSDMERSVRYYVDGLGFEITHKWIPEGEIRWCRLERGGAALMLESARSAMDGKPGLGITLYVNCKDALAIFRECTSKGIQALKPFVGNGMWVTRMTDPDGYRVYFESPTDVPEGTELSG